MVFGFLSMSCCFSTTRPCVGDFWYCGITLQLPTTLRHHHCHDYCKVYVIRCCYTWQLIALFTISAVRALPVNRVWWNCWNSPMPGKDLRQIKMKSLLSKHAPVVGCKKVDVNWVPSLLNFIIFFSFPFICMICQLVVHISWILLVMGTGRCIQLTINQ